MRAVRLTVTVIIVLAVLASAGLWLRARVGHRRFGGNFVTHAYFRDALGLPLGSKVVIAGIQVGEIEGLSLEGRVARVSMRLHDDVVLWDDAFAERKASSLFGDNYVELSPGGPADPSAGDAGHRRLRSGEPIPRVVDGDSTDRLLRRIDRAMPRVEQAMAQTDQFLATARKYIDGTATERLAAADRVLADGAISAPLANADRAMDRLTDWTTRAAEVTHGAAAEVDDQLDGFDAKLVTARDQLHTASDKLKDALAGTRADLDDLDEPLAAANAWLARNGAANGDPDRTVLGTLVDDPVPGQKLHDLAVSGADFTAGVGRLRTWVGLRTEYNVLARAPRFYVTAELAGRNDRFFKIELEKGPLGDLPNIDLSDADATRDLVRRININEHYRLTAQWGKHLGWLSVRFGLKESSLGAGVDALMLGGRLHLETDVFGRSYSRLPRVKLAAALHVFRSIYILGGVDDLLTPGGYLSIAPWPADQTVPIQFERFRYGRDYFGGFVLRFDEADLKSLLFTYGSMLARLQ